jgi:hypothetical protein
MKRYGWPIAWAAFFFLYLTVNAFAGGKVLYENNFEKAAAGPMPDEFLVLDGDFSIKESDGNKYVELPGAPLDTFGVLFGPTTKDAACASARIYATSKGRRFPQFAIGLAGQNGYKLKISAAKDAVEIFKGDTSLASAPYHWKTGTWTVLKLRIRPDGSAWKIEGKAWTQTDTEPKDWTITLDEKETPHPGRASFWGSPVSSTPIRFDDLLLTEQ